MKGIGRNDRCWCGSGKKFKHCHLRRGLETPRPFEAIVDEARRAGAYQTCLHPLASKANCGKVISAHTLQRSRVLREITDSSNHVLTFYPMEGTRDGRLQLHRRGWRQSSTFAAFCDKHDGATFAPLEDRPFSATREQIFLIGYRALCWELYQKQRVIRASPVLRDLLDRGKPEEVQRIIQGQLGVQRQGFEKGLAEATRVKELMDQALLSGDFADFETLRIDFDGPVGVAATGGVTPNRTISGVPLQTLHDSDAPSEWLTFGVDVGDAGASVVFIWHRSDSAPRRYLDEMIALTDQQRAAFLVQFFFAHCENTYFAADWWNGLDADSRLYMEALMANGNPYYYPPNYSLDAKQLAPWTAATVHRA